MLQRCRMDLLLVRCDGIRISAQQHWSGLQLANAVPCHPEPASRPVLCLPQVSASVLSADEAHDPDVLSINAASAALACSDVAWAGPVGAIRMAVPIDGGAPIVNATREQAGAAALSALVVGTENRILYIEAEVTLGSNLAHRVCCVGLAFAQQHFVTHTCILHHHRNL